MNALKNKTKDQLIKEIETLEKQVRELEFIEDECKLAKLANDQMQEMLRDAKEQFSTIVEAAPSLLIICDADGNNEYVSPNCEKITGYTQEELQSEVKWWVHEDDIVKAKELFERTFRKRLGGKDFEYKAVKKNGEVWYASNSWEPIINEEGKFKGIVFQTTDITKRKLAELASRQAEEKLNNRMNKLEKFNRLMIERELKMIELKKEVNDLLERSELQKKYSTG